MNEYDVIREVISKIDDDEDIKGKDFKEFALKLIKLAEFERELSNKKEKLYVRFMK
ncbi:hypothetical protein D3C74_209950 [compost metagenome]